MIRQATPTDFLAIAALDRTSWKANRSGEFIPDGEHVWRIWCEHALVAIAEVSDRIVGVVAAFPCVAGPWCLHKIFVEATARGTGVGTELMAYITSRADELGIDLFLTVDPVNEKAIGLYRSSGFTESRLVQGFYRSNEDRYVLTRRSETNHKKGIP